MSLSGETMERRAMLRGSLYDGPWTGIVEDVADPEYRGRLKIRVPLLHPDDRGLFPTSHLPWAERINFSGGSGDQGTRWIPPVGAQVEVLFTQGDTEEPRWMGAVDGEDDVPAEYRHRPAGSAGKNVRGYPVFPGSNLEQTPEGAALVHVVKTPLGNKLLMMDSPLTPGFVLESSAGTLLVADDHPNRRHFEITTPSRNGLLLDDGDTQGAAYTAVELHEASGHFLRMLGEPGVRERIFFQSAAGQVLFFRDDPNSATTGPALVLRTTQTTQRLSMDEDDEVFPGNPKNELFLGSQYIRQQEGPHRTDISTGGSAGSQLLLEGERAVRVGALFRSVDGANTAALTFVPSVNGARLSASLNVEVRSDQAQTTIGGLTGVLVDTPGLVTVIASQVLFAQV